MSDVLKDLWEGKIAPSRDIGKDNVEIEIEMLCVERDLNLLHSSLVGRDFDILVSLEKHYAQLVDMQREYAFKQGFSLAMKLDNV